MIRDITLGQFYPAESLLHRLDPRVKFIAELIFLASLFIVNSWGYLICTAVLVIAVVISRVPVRFMLKGLKPVLFILLLTAVLNMLLIKGTVIWQFGFWHITEEGLRTAAVVVIRLVLLIIGASLLTLTTMPSKLMEGMEALFSPLKLFHIPVHDMAMVISIALRFIPVLIEETDRIMKAQTARGADFESGGLLKKIKALLPILVPLFVSAFRRADELALAMDARCYNGGEGRTSMKPLKQNAGDAAGYIISFAFLALIIFLRIRYGW